MVMLLFNIRELGFEHATLLGAHIGSGCRNHREEMRARHPLMLQM
jgi:hypothetical protein